MPKRFEWSDHVCSPYCKVHYYWDFKRQYHMLFPTTYNIMTQAGWLKQTVFTGPPGWYPRKPTELQWVDMAMICPHNPPQLTCKTCRRHEFRAVQV